MYVQRQRLRNCSLESSSTISISYIILCSFPIKLGYRAYFLDRFFAGIFDFGLSEAGGNHKSCGVSTVEYR